MDSIELASGHGSDRDLRSTDQDIKAMSQIGKRQQFRVRGIVVMNVMPADTQTANIRLPVNARTINNTPGIMGVGRLVCLPRSYNDNTQMLMVV